MRKPGLWLWRGELTTLRTTPSIRGGLHVSLLLGPGAVPRRPSVLLTAVFSSWNAPPLLFTCGHFIHCSQPSSHAPSSTSLPSLTPPSPLQVGWVLSHWSPIILYNSLFPLKPHAALHPSSTLRLDYHPRGEAASAVAESKTAFAQPFVFP